MKKRNKEFTAEQKEEMSIKSYFDRIAPGTVKFFTDHYICGNYYKSVWVITEYPPNTEQLAILAHLADKNGVTLRIYNRMVESIEQDKIVQHAMRTNHMMTTVHSAQKRWCLQNDKICRGTRENNIESRSRILNTIKSGQCNAHFFFIWQL